MCPYSHRNISAVFRASHASVAPCSEIAVCTAFASCGHAEGLRENAASEASGSAISCVNVVKPRISKLINDGRFHRGHCLLELGSYPHRRFGIVENLKIRRYGSDMVKVAAYSPPGVDRADLGCLNPCAKTSALRVSAIVFRCIRDLAVRGLISERHRHYLEGRKPSTSIWCM